MRRKLSQSGLAQPQLAQPHFAVKEKRTHDQALRCITVSRSPRERRARLGRVAGRGQFGIQFVSIKNNTIGESATST